MNSRIFVIALLSLVLGLILCLFISLREVYHQSQIITAYDTLINVLDDNTFMDIVVETDEWAILQDLTESQGYIDNTCE